MKEKHTSAKDFFLHLLAIVTLYGSVISLITILFQLVNLYLPDALYDPNLYGFDGRKRTLRSALATLIVMFPAFVIVRLHLESIYKKSAKKLFLPIRKWLIYFTLFVASIILIIDVITLLNSLLNGELTIRFFLKVLSVFIVVGGVVLYFVYDAKRSKK